jgi:hypothetical protein
MDLPPQGNESMNTLIRQAAGRGTVTVEAHADADVEQANPPVLDFDAGARSVIPTSRSVNGAANDWMRASALGVHPSQLPAHMRSAA